ncbi:hypothetical protein HCB45_10670 [Listeria sp. FSL L7-0091]|uniref:Uncharacterized protein n=1 Tax=Listeria farberi TaxID=2713500 RepID=A0A7X1DF05_9LIST|nr:hypothetical protein [Listeria farberi]MBC1376222.1 hypothetical protein [Listeria farberi]MBC1380161.1 hypothetical protein [Listeria farberi]MBC2262048.1 hypothetical protein [Listeria farberi]MBC2266392.1 hypothetical protein [Listeria farberi]MBC2288274.1 hypothetical protein [Listeria farberi]
MTKSLEELSGEIGTKVEKIAHKTGEVAGTAAKISIYSSIWAVKTGINKSQAFVQGFKKGWSAK